MSHKSKHDSSLDSSNSSKIKRQDSEHRRSSRVVGAKKVHGFDTQLISLEKMVQQRQSSDQFKAVAIVGKRGVGKTTLCQALFNRVQADFLPRIWVCMSWKPTEYGDRKTTTVKRMLTCLGVEDETIQSILVPEADPLSSLLYALHLQLTGKKYLIVLDDADNEKKKGGDAIKEGDDADQKQKKGDDAFKKWLSDLDSPITEKEKWGKCLAFGLPKGHGGTVIVTSRDENLAKVMVGEKNLLHLRPLSDPKSCSFIYNDLIDIQELNNDPEQKEFLKKCAGLPFAAAMMGKIRSEELVKAAKEAEEKAAKEPAKKMEPKGPISSKDEEKNKTEETRPIQPDEAAKSSKDDKKIKSEEVPAGEKHIQQQEKDARSSIGSKDDEQIKSEEHPAEAEPGPHQEGAAHNEIIEAASGTN
ncbi:hypothetical protein CMV_027077 [Castanea mollissima]|nr:hypothetical protein CMV_027077 [Castanea mollissima]